METERVQVTVLNLARPPGLKSTVVIDLHQVIQELIKNESGLTTLARSYMNPTSQSTRILLEPHNFTPRHLSKLLRYKLHRELQYCQNLAETIASHRFPVANNSHHDQRPIHMKVNVAVNELRFISRPVVSVPMNGGSRDVFQRLLEEQSVDSFDVDETCSICTEKLSESTSECTIIQMPNCLRLFHQDCIFEWLSRHNSCPLFRSVPYEEDQRLG